MTIHCCGHISIRSFATTEMALYDVMTNESHECKQTNNTHNSDWVLWVDDCEQQDVVASRTIVSTENTNQDTCHLVCNFTTN